MVRLRLLTLLIVSAFVIAAARSVPARPHSEWLAMAGRQSRVNTPFMNLFYTTPEIVLFRDGQLVWFESNNWRNGDGENPEAWRTAHLTDREQIDFHQLLYDSEFFTVELPAGTQGVDHPDGGHVFLAAHMGSRGRAVQIAARYLPESWASRRFFFRMNEVLDGLRCLTQRVSAPFHPSAIRVIMLKGQVAAGAPVAEWPTGVKPGMLDGVIGNYTGKDVDLIIETLSRTSNVTVDGEAYYTAWAPVLAVPSLDVNPSPTPGTYNGLPVVPRTAPSHVPPPTGITGSEHAPVPDTTGPQQNH